MYVLVILSIKVTFKEERLVWRYNYYDLYPTQASRGLARVKTERMAGR